MQEDSAVREEVFAHIQDTFGVQIHSYIPNLFGLYNMKWIVETSSKNLFIKWYHPKRYRLSEPHRRLKIERSLTLQQTLHNEAGICPAIWSKGEELILETQSGHFYVIMECFNGSSPKAGLVNEETMYELGKAIGCMHSTLSPFPAAGNVWTPSIVTMQESWRDNLDTALNQTIPNEKALRFIKLQGHILSEMDLSIFDVLEPGWAHWDLWVDNILLDENGEVSIVDFDTIQFGYLEIDIARVILSCALHEGKLRKEAVTAFLNGYRKERIFLRSRLPLAFKLLWCREANWWLKTDMDDFSRPPRRFAEEMMWLTEQWTELENLCGDF